jgi:hypothetical protein
VLKLHRGGKWCKVGFFAHCRAWSRIVAQFGFNTRLYITHVLHSQNAPYGYCPTSHTSQRTQV